MKTSFVAVLQWYLVDTWMMLENAKKNVAILKSWVDKGYDIITACTSCGLMLKQEYQELFDFEGMSEYASHMYDSMEYLAMLNDQGLFNTDFKQSTKNISIMLHAT